MQATILPKPSCWSFLNKYYRTNLLVILFVGDVYVSENKKKVIPEEGSEKSEIEDGDDGVVVPFRFDAFRIKRNNKSNNTQAIVLLAGYCRATDLFFLDRAENKEIEEANLFSISA